MPGLAGALNNLGNRLSELGRREEALAPAQEAVDHYTGPGRGQPGRVPCPIWGMALNNLGSLLSELGRREEALAPSQEAIDHYRALAEANPAAHVPGLATALDNLGILLAAEGDAEAGERLRKEAAAIRRRLLSGR